MENALLGFGHPQRRRPPVATTYAIVEDGDVNDMWLLSNVHILVYDHKMCGNGNVEIEVLQRRVDVRQADHRQVEMLSKVGCKVGDCLRGDVVCQRRQMGNLPGATKNSTASVDVSISRLDEIRPRLFYAT